MKKILSLVLVLIMLTSLVACTGETTTESNETQSASGTTSSASTAIGEAATTDVGTPRAETLVFANSGADANAGQFNPYLANCAYQNSGFVQFIWEPLWEIDQDGESVPILAESMAEPVDDTYTKFEVKLREGVKWSDGVEFTSADVVYTSDLLLNTPDLTYSAVFSSTVKSITAIDEYTILIETVKKTTRLETTLGSAAVYAMFKILPKHIWENVDATTYNNYPMVGTGRYTLADYDENGNYFLFEKREDWDCSACGIIYGEPTPNYILYESFGSEEKRVMAAINNQADILYETTNESYDAILAGNSEVTGWLDSYPYGLSRETSGILFNCASAPLDNTNVRWALTLSLQIDKILLAANGGVTKVCPIAIPPGSKQKEAYVTPMLEWLQNFTLSDGYKPFDNSYAKTIVAALTEQGIEGLTTDEEEMKDVYGIGWWKYDTEEAEKLLLAEGFTRDSDGMWLLPDGTPWQINIIAPNYISDKEKLLYAVADAWKQFGIDAVVQSCDKATYQSNMKKGLYDCCVTWPNLCPSVDITVDIEQWTSSLITPIGEDTLATSYSKAASGRYASETIDAIFQELKGLEPDDTSVVELTTEFLKEIVTNNPFMMVGSQFALTAQMTHYWTGYPDAESVGGIFTWNNASSMIFISDLESTGNQ